MANLFAIMACSLAWEAKAFADEANLFASDACDIALEAYPLAVEVKLLAELKCCLLFVLQSRIELPIRRMISQVQYQYFVRRNLSIVFGLL